ncbi:MAG: nitroreductase/quinone reductase family protein [Actinomycetota bacterium]|nr:nitroreductase/quinone reductase family protein [Actinomycetota bacterium]
MKESAHYQPPGWLTRNILNRGIARMTRMGVSVAGSRVLRVRGRVSGQVRTNPVNVLSLDGERYLVAPRGQTDWVRNLRAAGTGELVVGRRVETFTATEIAGRSDDTHRTAEQTAARAAQQDDALLIAVLRAYLRRWKWEVGQFFAGVGPDSTDSQLLSIAPRHPIFRIETLSR